MRKPILSLSLAVLAVMSAGARSLSPSEALNRALNQSQTGVSRSVSAVDAPVMTVGTVDSPSLYVFNKADGGWMIVSADDVAAPVIAYNDSGFFDPENMPENLEGWLQQCSEQIQMASASGAEPYAVSRATDREPIAPMVKTIWDQTTPFNRSCPKINGFYVPTGCVATAMAQVMKYFNWPEQAASDAVISYRWRSGQTDLSADFSNYKFDWANMLDSYRNGYNDVQVEAVSKLMQACGYSVQMEYGSSASGAVCEIVGNGLAKYFKYDRGLHNEPRALYKADEWESMIYDNLKNVGPIVYWGGIHCFVCDGYSENGYFHFNWGWSGSGDGYFRLNALNPNSVGTGGSSDGYNSNQGALLGAKPAGDVPAEPCYTFYSTGITSARVTGTWLYMNVELKNYSPFTVDVTHVFSVYNEDGTEHIASVPRTPTSNGNTIAFAPDLRVINTNGSIPTAIFKAGTFRIYPAVVIDGKEYLFRTPASEPAYVIYTRTKNGTSYDNSVTLPDVGKKVILDLSTNGDFYINQRMKISGVAQFTGDADASMLVQSRLLNANGGEVAQASTATINFTPEGNYFEFFSLWFSWYSTASVTPGDYIFALSYVDVTSGQYINLATCPVTVKDYEIGSYDVTGFTVDNPTAVDPNDIQLTAYVTGLTGVIYASLYFEILTPDNLTKKWEANEILYVTGGNSVEVKCNASLPSALPGEVYKAYVYKKEKGSPVYVGGPITITIGETSGIHNVEASDDAPVEYFNLQGMRVDSANLTPGIYIRRQGSKVSKIKL